MLNLAIPSDDGLEIPDVGDWSRDKHHFLSRYIDAFTTAMKGKNWSGLHYVDLFSGAGIGRLRESRQLEWGSPLIAAQATYPFASLHLCEQDSKRHAALQTRLKQFRSNALDQVLCGDANAKVDEIVNALKGKRSLSLAFLDPYNLLLRYETLRKLSVARADLIVFFPDRLDILRNWKAYYWDDPDSNLDGALGPDSNWRERLEAAPSPDRRVQVLVDLYQEQIGKLGYTVFEREGIPSNRSRLYWLIFCSKSDRALKIWNGISEKKPGGQRSFKFD